MDLETKRKFIDVLRGTIGSGHTGTQDELREYLLTKGFTVTQSTISRALKKIGAIKTSLEDGGSRYELKSNANIKAFGGRINDLVISTLANETMIVLKTTPGAAMFVAGYIDHYCKENILGTIAGDDTIFISPISVKEIDFHKNKILDYMAQTTD